MKNILLIGGTGSIGQATCSVIRTHPEAFRLVGVVSRTQRAALARLHEEFKCPVFCGDSAAEQAVREIAADLVVVATVGLSGLAPTLLALQRNTPVALATKEVLVAAGGLVCATARAHQLPIIPIDSEHSALFQCLQARGVQTIRTLTLTASGGPFRCAPADLSSVTPQEALHHPRWQMGPRVSIDSATMMNKGFEVLEAMHLFEVPYSTVRVVVHPESIIHSLVTWTDGTTLAQLAQPDMRLPIQYALSYPDRLASPWPALDFESLRTLTFEGAPDGTRFPCFRLASEAAQVGGVAPLVLSSSDEVAVSRFLAGDISFTHIPLLVAQALEKFSSLGALSSAEETLALHAEVQAFTQALNRPSFVTHGT